MSKKTIDETVPGIPTEMTEEELIANREKTVREKKYIINQINDISVPASVTIFSHGGPWTFRNVAFWEIFKKGDEDIVDFIEKFLSEKK